MLESEAEDALSAAGVTSVSKECSAASDPLDPNIGYVINQSGNSSVTITILKESCP